MTQCTSTMLRSGSALTTPALPANVHLYLCMLWGEASADLVPGTQASKDLGFLMNPGEGAVTAVAFYTPLDSSQGPTHLLSGSADGCIAVWAVESDWDCVKTLKGHK